MQTRSSPDLPTLHRLAQQESIENYEVMSKETLFNALNTRRGGFARLMKGLARSGSICRKVVLAENPKRLESQGKNRTSRFSKSKSAGVPKEEQLNEFDPIMLTPIGTSVCFVFARPNGTKIRFGIEPLVDYMLSSGEFSDPETRIPFSDENLMEIDRIVKDNGLHKTSVLESKKNNQKYSESKFRRDALLAIERCAGEVVTHILQSVETLDAEDAQEELLTSDFPQYADYFRQMWEVDRSYASKCSAHWRLYLQGPPNRPNKDRTGLLRAAILFLKNCDNGLYS